MDDNISAVKEEINIETDCQSSGPGKEVCSICWKSFELVPKIRCAECLNTVLCMQCFSLGLESKAHHFSHAYHIDRRHIPLDPEVTWTIYEDGDLLTAVLECGYGNFEDIGKRFLHKTFEEIRIRIDELLSLDKAPLLSCIQVNQKPILNYNSELLKEEPPRYVYRSHQSRAAAGYSAPRGDFDVEIQNNAEEMLANIESDSDDDDDKKLTEEDKELSDTIAYSLAQCYNAKILERQRHKNLIKEHALLLKKSSYINMLQLNPRMVILTQFMDFDDYNGLIEGFKKEKEVKRKFLELSRYRCQGVRKLRACSLYDRLNKMRNETKAERFSWTSTPGPKVFIPPKKAPQPIDISNLAGYTELTQKEKLMCATLRVMPELYLKFKKSLREVDAAEGGVRLMTARQLIKIDVNKTRKLYNFLRDEGYIKAK